ncbi:SH3 and PX domain-containing protein 2A isoform X4 [Lingula anatina]|uniref:SH3 and PX domain-containing protein 2A isoform X4 n=1 Tax=Lingula anatina TaxID=7574 RepID=A0A1S3K678_LINAN|nr:SH3 and PX domain-containing protein 2A isoform X4 [Lingula anatina]|eukprot:XP_013417761.1 SH3 and PX domain-containing protein 2A isoform X4 [Lingula anatina]
MPSNLFQSSNLPRKPHASLSIMPTDGRRIDRIECIQVEKRSYPQKHHVYVLQVIWSDGEKYPIYRKYSQFFDLRAQMKEEHADADIPELPGISLFLRGGLFHDHVIEKKRKSIEDFCQKILQLPQNLVKSSEFISFFEPWSTDLPQPDTKVCKASERTSQYSPSKRNSDHEDHKERASLPPVSTDFHSHVNDRPVTVMSPSSHDQGDTQLYKAVMVYNKRKAGEVNLTDGDVVTVLEKCPSGWWFVHLERSDQEGWAPGAFLEPLQGKEEEPQAEDKPIGRCVTLCDYIGDGEDEVSYKKGEIVEVIETSMDGWWKVRRRVLPSCPRTGRQCGTVHGEVGVTPAIYLQNLDKEEKQTDKEKAIYSLLKESHHQHSIYGRQPPPRRTSSKSILSQASVSSKDSDLYAIPDKSKKTDISVSQNPPGDSSSPEKSSSQDSMNRDALNYTTINFDEKKNSKEQGKSKLVIIGEPGVAYAEIIPKALPPKKHAKDKGPTVNYENQDIQPKARTPSPIAVTSPQPISHGAVKQQKTSEPKDPKKQVSDHTYMNVVKDAGKHSYENIEVSSLRPEEELRKKLCHVSIDYTPEMSHQQGLAVKAGDTVQVERQESSFSYCLLQDKEKGCIVAEGWLPSDILDWREAGASPLPTTPVSPIVPSIREPVGSPPVRKGLLARGTGSSDDERDLIPKPELLEKRRSSANPPPMPLHPSPKLLSVDQPQIEKSEPAFTYTSLVALADYDSRHESVLSFHAGDYALLLGKDPKGWWHVNLGGLDGWVPGDYWREAPQAEKTTSPKPSPRLARKHKPKSPELKTKAGKTAMEWDYGKMSRHESESLLLRNGDDRDFLVRESMNRVGDYTISVRYSERVRHFPVETTSDGKYYIGKHNFSTLTKIVDYYQHHPLFFDDKHEAISLGKPLKVTKS